jgi:dTDP-4-dehydrorhamnose reductase
MVGTSRAEDERGNMSLTKSVMVIGGSGFVGSHVVRRLREQFKVFATYRSHPIAMRGVTYFPLALENRQWAKRLLRALEPQAIIYCAGTNDLVWAENNPEQADNVHVSGVAALAEASSLIQSKFIFISNPYTFDGKRGNYHETDTALPYHSFGKMKLSGENYVRTKTLNWVAVRSSPLYGRGVPDHPSFLDQLRMKLDRGQTVELSNREIHSFAPVSGLADMLASLIEAPFKNKVLHYGGLTKLSYFEFGREFAKAFGFPENLVVQTQQSPEQIAEREFEDYSVNSSQSIESLKIKPLLLQEGFDLLKKDLVPSTRSL